jgi:hypothetical protein
VTVTFTSDGWGVPEAEGGPDDEFGVVQLGFEFALRSLRQILLDMGDTEFEEGLDEPADP